MRVRPCAVTVTQLPETLNLRRGRIFFRQLESSMNIERPCIVLDCSKVRAMDRFVIHALLCCLEEAMKRDGDVKLAGVSQAALETLELARVDRLFEIYENETDAVQSFSQPNAQRAADVRGADNSEEVSESAA